jgi:hypothetical protein
MQRRKDANGFFVWAMILCDIAAHARIALLAWRADWVSREIKMTEFIS